MNREQIEKATMELWDECFGWEKCVPPDAIAKFAIAQFNAALDEAEGVAASEPWIAEKIRALKIPSL